MKRNPAKFSGLTGFLNATTLIKVILLLIISDNRPSFKGIWKEVFFYWNSIHTNAGLSEQDLHL
jgi:hypothetical protein